MNILVVEDDVTAMESCCCGIRSILNKCDIYPVGTAEKAIEIMNRHRIDLFFIDIKLPEMQGDVLAGIIRRHPMYALTQIVFVTGLVTNEAELHKLYHHYEYVKKPFTLESFAADVGELLRDIDRSSCLNQSELYGCPERYVLMEDNQFYTYMKLCDLLYAEKIKGKNRLRIVTKQNVYYNYKRGLENFIEEINDSLFIRCHKSFAVYLPNAEGLKKRSRHIWTVDFENAENEGNCLVGDTYYPMIAERLDCYRTGKSGY